MLYYHIVCVIIKFVSYYQKRILNDVHITLITTLWVPNKNKFTLLRNQTTSTLLPVDF